MLPLTTPSSSPILRKHPNWSKKLLCILWPGARRLWRWTQPFILHAAAGSDMLARVSSPMVPRYLHLLFCVSIPTSGVYVFSCVAPHSDLEIQLLDLKLLVLHRVLFFVPGARRLLRWTQQFILHAASGSDMLATLLFVICHLGLLSTPSFFWSYFFRLHLHAHVSPFAPPPKLWVLHAPFL